jgi:hypothetical protein
MIETVEKEIDGVRYQFTPLMAKAARNELDQLIQRFGPSIANGIKGLQAVGDFNIDTDVDELATKIAGLQAVSGSLGNTLEAFCGALTPAYHANLARIFLSNVLAEVEVPNPATGGIDMGMQKLTEDFRNIYFATKLLTETKVLIWCLEVQYGDFFEPLGRAREFITRALEMMNQSASKSPKDSTGTSTESPVVSDTAIQ